MLRALEDDEEARQILDDFRRIGDDDINFNVAYWDTLLATDSGLVPRLAAAENIIALVEKQKREIGRHQDAAAPHFSRHLARADRALIAFANEILYETVRAIALGEVGLLEHRRRIDKNSEFLETFDRAAVNRIILERDPDRGFDDNLKEASFLYATIRDTIGYAKLVMAT